MDNKIFFIGIILIFLGIMLIIASSLTNKTTNVKSAGIVFIGPFPLGYSTDKGMFYILMIITLIALILFYILKR